MTKTNPRPDQGAFDIDHADVRCGECGSPMRLTSGRFSWFWSCVRWPDCDGTHGAHANGAPLGIPANRATKDARMAAHAAFDAWRLARRIPRAAAYAVLARSLGIDVHLAHIGRFTIAECERVVALARAS